VLYDESLIVAKGGGIENVIVWARNRDIPVPPGKKLAPSVMLRTDRGRFNPHVVAMRSSQKLIIENNDPIVYNFNLHTIRQQGVDVLLAPKGGKAETQFKETTLPVQATCNIHSWMKGWLFVRDNPYFAVTSTDGTFTIKNLPAGQWEFVFWHEKAGYLKHKTGWPQGRRQVPIGTGATQLGAIKVSYEDFDLKRPSENTTIGELQGTHPIWVAAAAGNKDRVLQLFDNKPEMVNWRNESGFAPLHWAAMQETVDAAKLLLEVGANVAVKQGKYGGTPLQYAASHGSVEICRVLLSHDASVDQPDNFGLTPLMRAVVDGKLDTARFLIEHGADVNARANLDGNEAWAGGTALYFATREKHNDVVQLLLESGADRTIGDKAGRTIAEPTAPRDPICASGSSVSCPHCSITFSGMKRCRKICSTSS